MEGTAVKNLKGKGNFNRENSSRKYIGMGWRGIVLTCLPILFAGCVSLPDIAHNCEAYGVSEDHQPMGSMVHIEPLRGDQLEVSCAGAEMVAFGNPVQGEIQISGCAIPHPDGMVRAYFRVGDHCAKSHELCHALHGRKHTARYEHDLRNGVPMPYCPRNQLGI